MLEQEIASIMKFTLEKAGNPSPYYYKVPEGFLIPSVYFPVPEVTTRGDTFRTYALEYTWFIKFFGFDEARAQALAFTVLTAIKTGRNRIPLIGTDGKPTGQGFRLKDPTLKRLDGTPGVAQLGLSWDSPRPYDDPEAQKMMVYDLTMYGKNAYEAATQQLDANTQSG